MATRYYYDKVWLHVYREKEQNLLKYHETLEEEEKHPSDLLAGNSQYYNPASEVTEYDQPAATQRQYHKTKHSPDASKPHYRPAAAQRQHYHAQYHPATAQAQYHSAAANTQYQQTQYHPAAVKPQYHSAAAHTQYHSATATAQYHQEEYRSAAVQTQYRPGVVPAYRAQAKDPDDEELKEAETETGLGRWLWIIVLACVVVVAVLCCGWCSHKHYFNRPRSDLRRHNLPGGGTQGSSRLTLEGWNHNHGGDIVEAPLSSIV
jgi:hypothetical protein